MANSWKKGLLTAALTAGAIAAYKVYKDVQDTSHGNYYAGIDFPDILKEYKSNQGNNLHDYTQKEPVLLVFLRHFGCSFCRETVSQIAENKEAIERDGTKVVFVHMGVYEDQADAFFARFGLPEAEHVSDPACGLYEAFGVGRAQAQQIFSPWAIWRGIKTAFIDGYGVGAPVGDGFRLSAAFLIHKKEILKAYRHQTVADTPDYIALGSCDLIAS